MREIHIDEAREVVTFCRCFFHPFVPVFRRRCVLRLAEIGRSFTARSGDESTGERIEPWGLPSLFASVQWTVSALTKYIRDLLEGDVTLQDVWVSGEI